MMSDMFGKVDVKTEELEGSLQPLVFADEDKKALGMEDEPVQSTVETEPVEEVYHTSETAVRSMIKSLFFAGYVWHGEGHEHWLENEAVLEEIVPGMTKFVNQFPGLARAVEAGDTNAAPVKFFIVAVKHQFKSIRIKREEAKLADPTVQTSGQGGGGLYEGLPTA